MTSASQIRKSGCGLAANAQTYPMALAMVFLLAVGGVPAAVGQASRATLTISSFASGNFGAGYAHQTMQTPLVRAITVPGPGTITVTYVSGSWCAHDGTDCSGANGTAINDPSGVWYDPLQEASGVAVSASQSAIALMGAFVPQLLTQQAGFVAMDGTKLTSGVGIMPNQLFFVGAINYIPVSGPGTLYLGINDWYVDDNSGALTVTVSYLRGRQLP